MPQRLLILLSLTWLLAVPATSHGNIDLWPLLEISDESTTVLYPFYVHQGKFLMLFPFFYRTHEGRDHHLVWPFVKFSEGRLTRLLPVWFSPKEGEYTLFPLFRWTPQEIFWPLPPTYLQRDGGLRLILPLYAKRGDKEVIPPTFYRVREEDKPVRIGIWPILEYRGSPERKSAHLLRFLRSEWGEEFFWFRLWPLFSWHREKDSRSLWLVPFHYDSSEKHTDISIYPIFASRSDEETSGFWLAPFLYASSPRGFKTFFLGIFDIRRWSMAGTENVQRSQTFLGIKALSVYRRSTVTSPEGELLERKRRLLIFSDQLEPSGKRSFRVLGIPVVRKSQ